LITGYGQVYEAAMAAGADGLVISGAGPTLLTLTARERGDRVVKALATSWQQVGVQAQVIPLAIDTQGTKVQ
jgi:homoserine kinase